MQTQSRKTIGRSLLAAFITGAITVMNALVIDHCTSKKNSLSYYTHLSEPFEKDSVHLGIYHMELLNDGDEMVEDIKGIIQFEGQHIVAFKLKGSPTLNIRDSLAGSNYHLNLASLNPMEKLAMAFLVSGIPPSNGMPLVDIRAKGLKALGRAGSSWSIRSVPLYAILLVAMVTAVTLHTFLASCWMAFKGRSSKSIKPEAI
jgi:hypothetical protein